MQTQQNVGTEIPGLTQQVPLSQQSTTVQGGPQTVAGQPSTQQTNYPVKPIQGGETTGLYEPQIPLKKMTPEQLQALFANHELVQFNDQPIINKPTEVFKLLEAVDGIRIETFRFGEVASSDAAPKIPITLRTAKDLLLSATSQIHQLQVKGSPWIEGSSAIDKMESPLLGPVMFANVPQLPSLANTKAVAVDEASMHLFVFSPLSHKPVLVLERRFPKTTHELLVYSSESQFLGRVESSSSLLRKKIVIYGPDDKTIIYTLKSLKMTSSGDLMIREGKNKVGMFSRRFSTVDAHDNEAGYDLFFPKHAMLNQRCLLLGASLYLDQLWNGKI